MISTTCPSCGSRDYIDEMTCVCGYHSDDSFSETIASISAGLSNERIKGKVLKKLARTDSSRYGDEILIKEIDSWTFTYSEKEKNISIGTPALQSFRLRIELEDLENILEHIYKCSGEGKTLRKLQLNADEMPEVIDRISKTIEEKRRKIAVKFSDNEIQEIMELINSRLKVQS
jgi:hypothetical protein